MPTSVHASFPESAAGRVKLALPWVLIASLLGAPGPDTTAATRADLPTSPVPSPANATLPIDLDASFSELDRRNNRLVFKQLTITQGTLVIKADEATADPADFENSVWIFTGNVRIDSGPTRATADRAELKFRNNRLLVAALSGGPARFSQAATAGRVATEGHGQQLDYDLAAGTIELTTDAFLSDGKNEIAGNRIAYDLKREVVTAGARGDGEDGGQVRMRFTPKKDAAAPDPAAPEKAP